MSITDDEAARFAEEMASQRIQVLPELPSVSLAIPADVLSKAVAEALPRVLAESPAFARWVDRQIVTVIAEEAEKSEHFGEVRAQIRSYLDRYPALKDDSALRKQIGTAILDHIQGFHQKVLRENL